MNASSVRFMSSALTLATAMSMPPSSSRARLDPADQRGAIGDVERPAERLDAFALQRLHGARHAVLVARADRDVAALGGKRVGDRPPDALAAAGDDRLLASEPEIHPVPSSLGC